MSAGRHLSRFQRLMSELMVATLSMVSTSMVPS